MAELRGGSRVFSRGGADFQKTFENFDDLFYRSTKLYFPTKALKRRCFGQIFHFLRRAGKLLKKQVKKAIFANFLHFLENFGKKIAFFLARAPLKVIIYWRWSRL